MSLGNALPTETATATVDSCPVLQIETNETGKSGQRAASCAENETLHKCERGFLLSESDKKHNIAIQMTYWNLIPTLPDST